MKSGALVGFGYWGQNLLKALRHIRPSLKMYIFDKSIKARKSAFKDGFCVCSSLKEILESKEISFLIIATPPSTHYSLVNKGLDSNKNVLVEKPFGLYTEDKKPLFSMAKQKKKTLMVDYTYLYSPGFRKLKKLLANSKMTNYKSLRMNSGFPRQDTHVTEDLIIHDLSMLVELFSSLPLYGSCQPLVIDKSGVFQEAFVSLTGHKWRAWICASRVFSEKQRTVLVESSNKKIEFKERDGQTYIHLLDSGKYKNIQLENKTSLELMFKEFFNRMQKRSPSDDFLRYKKISTILMTLNRSMKLDGKSKKIHWKF